MKTSTLKAGVFFPGSCINARDPFGSKSVNSPLSDGGEIKSDAGMRQTFTAVNKPTHGDMGYPHRPVSRNRAPPAATPEEPWTFPPQFISARKEKRDCSTSGCIYPRNSDRQDRGSQRQRWRGARTRVGAASGVGQVSADVDAEHPPAVALLVHRVTAGLRQGVEIKQVTCSTQTKEL